MAAFLAGPGGNSITDQVISIDSRLTIFTRGGVVFWALATRARCRMRVQSVTDRMRSCMQLDSLLEPYHSWKWFVAGAIKA